MLGGRLLRDPTEATDTLGELLARAVVVVLADPSQAEDAARDVRDRAFALIERVDPPPPGLALLVRSAANVADGSAASASTLAGPTFIASSRAMQAIVGRVTTLASSDAPFLLIGPEGTGKRSLARLAHARGSRASRPFVVVRPSDAADARALEVLLADGLDAAGAGTLVLDRVDALSPGAQTAVLELVRGASSARFVATALPAVRAAERAGEFSTELYYRLARTIVDVPPLAERADDVPVLAYTFLREAADRYGLPAKRISAEALRSLKHSPFPGNVPELRTLMEQAATIPRDVLALGDFGFERPNSARRKLESPTSYVAARRVELESFERRYVEAVLSFAGGNITRAAEIAGMDRANFRRLMKRAKGRAGDPATRTKA
ncbi:MAG: sigma-54-dependent Fis family transcriptional regulator [Polyangiaceae bacterium]|nr:sigma-54-dependent Fis family transcriptional regulator [Polyangiaceae bacterium]